MTAVIDPAAARDAMAASDAAVDAAVLDEYAAEIWAWLADGNDPWRHALPFTDQTAIRVDAAVNNSDS